MTRESDPEKTDGLYQLDQQRRTLLKLAVIGIPASSAIASAGVASGQSNVQVTKKDLTDDGNDDIRIENSKVFLQFNSADISTRRLMSTAGRQGGSNLLRRGLDTRPTLQHGSHQHRPEFQSLKSVEILEDGGNVGAYRIVREYTYHDEPIKITADIKLFADDNFFLVYLECENTGNEPLALDQDPSNIHDGIQIFNRLGLAGRSDSDNDYRFHLAGQGTRKFTNTRRWQTFSGTNRGTFFDSQDALTYGLLDGATEPKMWIEETAHLDFLVQEKSLDPGQSISYRNVFGLHSGGTDAPDIGAQIYNDAQLRIRAPSGQNRGASNLPISVETLRSMEQTVTALRRPWTTSAWQEARKMSKRLRNHVRNMLTPEVEDVLVQQASGHYGVGSLTAAKQIFESTAIAFDILAQQRANLNREGARNRWDAVDTSFFERQYKGLGDDEEYDVHSREVLNAPYLPLFDSLIDDLEAASESKSDEAFDTLRTHAGYIDAVLQFVDLKIPDKEPENYTSEEAFVKNLQSFHLIVMTIRGMLS